MFLYESDKLAVRVETGLLSGIEFRQSPYVDERPTNQAIDLLVLHGISLPPGQFGGPEIDDLFMGQIHHNPELSDIHGLEVSIHLLIRRDGELIQYVPFHKRAWHAGTSNFKGVPNCNNRSIGIEIEGCDDIPYTDMQYDCLNIVVPLIMSYYPISPDHVVAHSDIAPGRKTDPGPAFDWGRLPLDR